MTQEQQTIGLALLCVAIGHGFGWLAAWGLLRFWGDEIKTDFKTLKKRNER